MNKYLMIVYAALITLLAILLYDPTPNEEINVSHPVYDSNYVEELLITTYHNPANNQPMTWDDLVSNDGYDLFGKKVYLDVLVQQTEDGKVCSNCLGYGLVSSNAVISLRGQSSRTALLKSFRITYSSDLSNYYGESILNLKKHYDDDLRVKNKLVFDIIKDIPNTLVPNTKFVQLTLRDLIGGNTEYVDLGLFTHHEQVDDNFFIRRELNPEGNLYNINYFDFQRYPETIKLTSNPTYNISDFEEYLEIDGSKDHTELISMLDAVNSNLLPINSVINQYFDRENYLTYLAINMLIDNIDGSARNFKLYRPEDSQTWYFIYWDLDKSFIDDNGFVDQWRRGVHLYMNDTLHAQFLKVDANREDLIDKVTELRDYFSEESIDSLITDYDGLIGDLLTNGYDAEYLKIPYSEILDTLEGFPEIVDHNYEVFINSFNVPKAVFIYQVENKGDYQVLDWSSSYDFNNEKITYSVKISNTPDMQDIVFEQNDVTDSQIALFTMEPGSYYVSVESTNESGFTMDSYEKYTDNNGHIYFGVKNIVVK